MPAESRWVLVARPRRLLDDPATGEVVRTLSAAGADPDDASVEPRPLGVPIRAIDELVYARLEHGGLLLIRGELDARAIVRERGEHMTGREAPLDSPDVVRAGFLGADAHYLRSLGGRIVLDASGSVGGHLAETLAAWEAGRARDPSEGPAAPGPLEELEALHEGAPLSLLVPGHLPVPDASGIGLLLAGQRGFVASGGGEAPDLVRLRTTFLGRFPPDAEESFRTWVTSLATSDLGHLLGMQEALPTFSFRSSPGRVDLAMDLEAGALARGARLLLVAEIPEILADPPG